MAEVVIRCVGHVRDGAHHSATGLYLRRYSPEARGGRGEATWTRDRSRAMRFANAGEAHRTWTAIPRNNPTRGDGRPNRPLTVFHIVIEPA